MKKFLKMFFTGLVGAVVITSGWVGYELWKERDLFWGSGKDVPTKPLWISDRPIPKTVDPGAYLAALNAVMSEDLEKAADLYLKVLAGDPENEKLQRETYFFNAILGKFDELRPVMPKLPSQLRSVFLTDYVRAGIAAKDGDWKKVREAVTKKDPLSMDEIVRPLILAWSYAGENNFEMAAQSLEPLKQRKGLRPYYYYHLGLIAMVLKRDFDADNAFKEMAQDKLLTFSMYPEIRAFYIRKGSWGLNNPFYVQWQLFNTEQLATAELIMQVPPKPMDATRGMAEAFYDLSTAMGVSQNGYEGALILSALSLYLNPDQDLPKIWNAEILEQVNKPQLARYYYGTLNGPLTQTVEFKRASNLMACGRYKEAMPLLQQLRLTNRDSSPLWLALANVYQKEKNWSAAIRAYTRILEIEGETNRNYASDIYFARSFLYTEQHQYVEAESDLRRALELNPENPMLLNHLGYQWLEKDQTLDKGFALVEKAYKLQATDPHIIDSMAYAYYRKAEYQKALPLAERTVDIMPQSSVANAHLGDIYKALGRHREAVFQYQKALSLQYDLTPQLKEELTTKISQNSNVGHK